MTCSRCSGLMTVDSFIDMEEDTGQLWLSAYRCLNCGQVTDPGVIRNRLNPRVLTVETEPRSRPRRHRASRPLPLRVASC